MNDTRKPAPSVTTAPTAPAAPAAPAAEEKRLTCCECGAEAGEHTHVHHSDLDEYIEEGWDLAIIPDPELREHCAPIDLFDEDLHLFLEELVLLMEKERGLGLAAPQVGVTERIAIIDLSVPSMQQPIITSRCGLQPHDHIWNNRLEIINPTLTRVGPLVSSEEGCLSIPDYRETIKRSASVELVALDRFGREFSLSATGLLSFAIQHEVDHLDGVLFVDYLSGLKRELFKRWGRKNIEDFNLFEFRPAPAARSR